MEQNINTETSSVFKVIVHNAQGASDTATCETRAEVNAYINSWHDPKELIAAVRDGNGKEVAHKAFGRKTVVWLGRPNR